MVRSRAKLILRRVFAIVGDRGMASSRKTLLAGVAAIGIGLAGVASAQTAPMMTMPVPGGGVAQIRYIGPITFGDVPPQVVEVPTPAAFGGWMPMSSVFGRDSPFAMLDRIAAEMDRRAAAMFRYAEAMTDRAEASANSPRPLLMRCRRARIPSGGESYSLRVDDSGNGMCSGERSDHAARRRDTAACRTA